MNRGGARWVSNLSRAFAFCSFYTYFWTSPRWTRIGASLASNQCAISLQLRADTIPYSRHGDNFKYPSQVSI